SPPTSVVHMHSTWRRRSVAAKRARSLGRPLAREPRNRAAIVLHGVLFGLATPLGDPRVHRRTKLYIYGYLNRVQSSRRLEREAERNVEVMWLTCRLVPDHKTIADFRKDNGKAKSHRENSHQTRRFHTARVIFDGFRLR